MELGAMGGEGWGDWRGGANGGGWGSLGARGRGEEPGNGEALNQHQSLNHQQLALISHWDP